MYVAIKYEKISLGEEKYVFKPVSVIKGDYDEYAEIFETEYGELCVPIDGETPLEDSYFGCLTTIDELKELYKSTCSEEELLMQFFEECMANYWIGYFDFVESKMKVLNIPCDIIEKYMTGALETAEEKESGTSIVFNLDNLKELMNISDPKEVYNKLKEIIRCAESIGEEPEKFSKKEMEQKNIPETSKQKKKVSLQKENSKFMSLKELRKEVKDVIKGQNKAVDDITRAIIVNQLSNNPRHKSHMLILGPSGTGKTEMINIISKKMGIPFFKADATAYTKEGYVGKSVYSMFDGLIQSANGNIEKAQKGILIIDEIDKKLSPRKDDVGGVDVLNSLLKIMDRDIIELDTGKQAPFLFDTSNLTIIFMGAFAELYKNKEEAKKTPIGFGTVAEPEKKSKIEITSQDLIKAGMPPEFLGRIPIVTNTEELSLEDLVDILYKSKGGAIDEEREFCKDLGITIKFTNGYMKEIAKKAHETKTGARNLRKLVRESVSTAYDEILSGKNVKVLKLTKKTAIDNKKYYTE